VGLSRYRPFETPLSKASGAFSSLSSPSRINKKMVNYQNLVSYSNTRIKIPRMEEPQMTKREDLERLAGECEVCALADGSSIDNHFLTCPSCSEHRLKAHEIAGEVARLNEIAKYDEVERRHILGYSVNDILNMSEQRRAEVMGDLFDNISDMNEEQRSVLIRTRTDLLTSLPKREREILMRTAKKVYSGYPPERKETEWREIEKVISGYNPLKRALVRRMYREVI
jgi:hypothetical protein